MTRPRLPTRDPHGFVRGGLLFLAGFIGAVLGGGLTLAFLDLIGVL